MSYDKHQRDYTILLTSVVMEEFFSSRFENFFSCPTRPAYLLVKDRVLFHYFNAEEKEIRARRIAKKYSERELFNYVRKINLALAAYHKFLKNLGRYTTLDAISRLHDFMAQFTAVIVLVAESPLYCVWNKRISKLFSETRRRYDDVHKFGMEVEKELLNRLEKERNLPAGCLQNLLINEFRKYLRSGSLPEGLAKRPKFFFAGHDHRGQHIYSRAAAQRRLARLEPRFKVSRISEFSGRPAFSGKAAGRVRLIRFIAEAKKLKSGEVLVASMTDPRYLPAMRKAAAIITDEGGLTCHAAIVARELGIPCIVGTKIATQVLNDGDRVAVDAGKGIVKITK